MFIIINNIKQYINNDLNICWALVDIVQIIPLLGTRIYYNNILFFIFKVMGACITYFLILFQMNIKTENIY